MRACDSGLHLGLTDFASSTTGLTEIDDIFSGASARPEITGGTKKGQEQKPEQKKEKSSKEKKKKVFKKESKPKESEPSEKKGIEKDKKKSESSKVVIFQDPSLNAPQAAQATPGGNKRKRSSRAAPEEDDGFADSRGTKSCRWIGSLPCY